MSKPKSKTIKTQTADVVTAITSIVKPNTIWDSLDKVTKDLSPGDTRFVQEQVHGVAVDMAKVHELKDSVASRLKAIHSKVGKEAFATMTETVFPRLGLSKSTCYRMVESAEVLIAVLPNPQVRQTLLGRFERPITTTDKNGKVILTPAFERAIKEIEPPKPAGDGQLTLESIDAYTAALASKTRELGKTKPKSKATRKKEAGERIEDAFARYMEAWGTEDANKLLNSLEELLSTEMSTIEAAPAAPKTAVAVPKKTA